MNNKLKLYLIFNISAGLTIISFSFWHIFNNNYNYWGILLFAILALISEYLAVNMKYGSISVGFAVNLATILIFGPYVGAIVAATGMFLRMRDGKLLEVKKILFNMSAMAITAFTAGHVFYSTGGNPGVLALPYGLIPIIATITTYFIFNNFIMTVVISLSQNLNFKNVWKDNLKWLAPNYLALGALGILIAGIYLKLGVAAILLFFIPLALARQSFKMYLELKDIHMATVQALISTIEAKDSYTKGHSERVAEIGAKIARKMGLSEKQIEKVEYAGYLHDVGKVSINNSILNKPDSLNKNEFKTIKRHPVTGANIIKNVEHLNDVADYVKYHHERMDGSGYPEGLSGEEIPLGACILAVADVYDALTSDRPYRKAWSHNKAVAMFKKESGVKFHPDVVDSLLEIIDERKKIS